MQIIFIRVHKFKVDCAVRSKCQFTMNLTAPRTAHLHLPGTLQPLVLQLTYIYQEPYSPQYSSPTFTRNLTALSTAHLHLPGALQPPSTAHLHLPGALQPPVQLTYIYQEPYSPQYSSPTFTRNLTAPSTAHLHLPGALQPPVQLTYIYQEPCNLSHNRIRNPCFECSLIISLCQTPHETVPCEVTF